ELRLLWPGASPGPGDTGHRSASGSPGGAGEARRGERAVRPDPGALVRRGAAAGIRGVTGPLTTVPGGDRAAPGPLFRPAGHQRGAVGSAETSGTASTVPGGADRGDTG